MEAKTQKIDNLREMIALAENARQSTIGDEVVTLSLEAMLRLEEYGVLEEKDACNAFVYGIKESLRAEQIRMVDALITVLS